MEQSVADTFHTWMRAQAKEKDIDFVGFSLNGQDRDAGADYLFASGNRFSLVEYKDSESDIKAESEKERRENLCELLENADNQQRKEQHDHCHYIAWLAPTTDLNVNIYRNEVCNTTIFKSNSTLVCRASDKSTRMIGTEFALHFMAGMYSLKLEEFEDYLKWMMTTASETEATTVELAAVNPDAGVFSMRKFRTVREAHDWMEKQRTVFRVKYPQGLDGTKRRTLGPKPRGSRIK